MSSPFSCLSNTSNALDVLILDANAVIAIEKYRARKQNPDLNVQKMVQRLQSEYLNLYRWLAPAMSELCFDPITGIEKPGEWEKLQFEIENVIRTDQAEFKTAREFIGFSRMAWSISYVALLKFRQLILTYQERQGSGLKALEEWLKWQNEDFGWCNPRILRMVIDYFLRVGDSRVYVDKILKLGSPSNKWLDNMRNAAWDAFYVEFLDELSGGRIAPPTSSGPGLRNPVLITQDAGIILMYERLNVETVEVNGVDCWSFLLPTNIDPESQSATKQFEAYKELLLRYENIGSRDIAPFLASEVNAMVELERLQSMIYSLEKELTKSP